MCENNVINAVKMALENTDKNYCELSKLVYSKSNEEIDVPKILKDKFLERPFVYEFYHQFRKLMDERVVDFGGPIVQAGELVVQAEVNKAYQHIFRRGRIPDLIIHKPNTPDKNLAVIEFKLASNLNRIKEDFEKLLEFKEKLKYKYLIEVIIGEGDSLKRAIERVKESAKSKGITIIGFDTGLWEAKVEQ